MSRNGTGLNSIQEVHTERSVGSSRGSGHSAGTSTRNSSTKERHHTSNESVNSDSIDNVFQMLEDEHAKYSQPHVNTSHTDDMDLEREIQEEIGKIDIGPGNDRSPPPQQAFQHAGHSNHHIIQTQAHASPSQSDDDSDDRGPVIYANHDDDDDFSQITSSIAGNTLYSHEYMFSSISYPKNKSAMNNRNLSGAPTSMIPSLDGTDSGGSTALSGISGGSAGGSGTSPLPPMDENVMDNDDFERFFGGPSNGTTHRRNANLNSSRSGDENDGPINVYKNSHIHSHNHISSHTSTMDDQNDDDITIGDIYSYAPSTMDGDTTVNHINSSNPLIWVYNQAYSLFNSGQWTANRKKNDDLDSIDDDADYFGTMMSSEFLSSSNQNFPWKKGHNKRKQIRAACIFGGLFFLGALVRTGDMGTEADLSMKIPERGKTEIKTETKINGADQRTNIRPPKKVVDRDRSHEGMPLPSVFDNFAEVTDPATNTIPFFWHIPRSAGATMNDIFSICHHLRVATNIGIGGGHDVDTKLQIINFEDQKFVNVDISTTEGIKRAVQMDFASSDLTDVAISSLLHDSAPLFSSTKKGKMFTMFRHPVDRIVSMFYFMQDTVWKAEATYNQELAEISIENFFLKQLGETNWHVRFLTNQLTKSYVDEEDFKLAKEILRRKAIVGLLSEKEESFNRFAKQSGWTPKRGRDLECQKRRLQWDWSLRHPHEVEVLEGNRLWNLISGQNSYDMRLYEYAQFIFEEQAQLRQ